MNKPTGDKRASDASGTWITRAEAATLLNRTERQMQRYASAGKLKPHSRRDPASSQLRIYYRRSQVLTLAKTVKPISQRALYRRTLETSLGIAARMVRMHQELLTAVKHGLVGPTFLGRVDEFERGLEEVEGDLNRVQKTLKDELKAMFASKRGKDDTAIDHTTADGN